MANGKWIRLDKGPQTMCFACGDLLGRGDDAYETDVGTYCSEGCADDAEAHNDGLMILDVCDYPD